MSIIKLVSEILSLVKAVAAKEDKECIEQRIIQLQMLVQSNIHGPNVMQHLDYIIKIIISGEFDNIPEIVEPGDDVSIINPSGFTTIPFGRGGREAMLLGRAS